VPQASSNCCCVTLRSSYIGQERVRLAPVKSAKLNRADLREAELHEADLRGTNLSRARLGGPTPSAKTRLEETDGKRGLRTCFNLCSRGSSSHSGLSRSCSS
jgi:uncharacterized protein YjbI with pentapeptide repeats